MKSPASDNARRRASAKTVRSRLDGAMVGACRARRMWRVCVPSPSSVCVLGMVATIVAACARGARRAAALSMVTPTMRGVPYGAGAADVTGLYLRYQGELLGLWDPQNRDLRRKPPPKRSFWLDD